MLKDIENPFANYGKIIGGKHFLGRQDSLLAIKNKVIRPENGGGNIAIIGLPGVGKSSLACHAVMEQEHELVKRKKLPIWIDLSNHTDAYDFYLSLVCECLDKLEEFNWTNPVIYNAANDVRRYLPQASSFWAEYYRSVQRFFEKVNRLNIHIIFILDKFDFVRQLFKGDPAFLNALRTLGDNPRFSITFVTTSRRSIHDIAYQTKGSPFDNIFEKIYLRPFSEKELDSYFAYLTGIGIPVEARLKAQIRFYAGGHPYLLAMLGYQLIEFFRENGLEDIETVLAHQREFFQKNYIGFYRGIEQLLTENDNLKKLLQLLFGAQLDVKPIDVDELTQYGLIQRNSQGTYTAFSDHFQLFLQGVEQDIQLWSLWRETEKLLRSTIADVLQKKYGEQWFDKLESTYKNFNVKNGKNFFERCRKIQQEAKQKWGDKASHNPLAFAYPAELLQLVLNEWNNASFKDLFGKDKNYWSQRAELLAKIRNPLAHNWDEVMEEHDRLLAKGYCKEIINVLQKAK